MVAITIKLARESRPDTCSAAASQDAATDINDWGLALAAGKTKNQKNTKTKRATSYSR